jgi:hypothetical protein
LKTLHGSMHAVGSTPSVTLAVSYVCKMFMK